MNTVTSVKPTLRLTDRLSFRLLALFLGIFLLTFLALFAWSISWSFAESALADAGVAARPKPIVIDPKLRDELAAVMSLDAADEPMTIKNPFNDSTGLVGIANAQRSVRGVVTTTGGPGASNSPGGTVASSTVGAPARSGNRPLVPKVPAGAGDGSAGPDRPSIPASEATKLRWERWLQRAVTDEVPLDPGIFAIDDLLPVGVVDGGNDKQEVLFYSAAAGRTLSFPVGTRFHDGWLAELRPEGVVFGFNDEPRTHRLRSWARSLQNVG